MKKALIITFYFPPYGKASTHLPLSVIRNLPEYGIEPVIVTVNEDSFSQKDEGLLNMLPPGIRVIRTDVWEPFNLYRKFTGKGKQSPLVASEMISKENSGIAHKISIWVRMNLFVPDARIGWNPYAISRISELLQNEHFDFIISFGPPHSSHLIARSVSMKWDIPFFPVFIEPWTDIVYYKNFKRSALTVSLDNYLERKVLHDSCGNFFVTETMKSDFIRKYPSIEKKSQVIYWGYDESAFVNQPQGTEVTSPEADSTETIVHAGNIFDYQNPDRLWEAINRLQKAGRKIRIKFIGTVSPQVKSSVSDHGLDAVPEYKGFLPYSEVIDELYSANYLLVCVSEKRHLPGKLFEYLRIGKPILAFGDDNEEVRDILHKSNAGAIFSYSEDPTTFFDKSETYVTDAGYISRFERKNAVGIMAEILLNNHKES